MSSNVSDNKLYAGIDLGTSGCRLICIDDNQIIQSCTSIQYPNDCQQSPELWWESVSKLLGCLSEDIKTKIASIAIDGTSGSILLTDSCGHPTSSTLMYNDLRAVTEADQIEQVLPIDNGGHGASGSLSRLMWLLINEPNPLHAHALHQADFILGKLTNNFSLSDENNCLKLGYDVINRCWPETELIELGINLELLPKVHRVGEYVSYIDKHIAVSLGLSENVKLVSGTTDSIAAFIATGVNKVGDAVTSLGSTLVVKQISDTPIFVPEFGVYSHRYNLEGKDLWLVGGASNSGGKVLKHYFTVGEMQALSQRLDVEMPTHFEYYPLLEKGERFPIADVNKAPKLTPRPADDHLFFQGMLEGIAAIEQQAYSKLNALGAPELKSVRTVGGGSTNDVWTQIRKKSLNVEMIKPSGTEAALGVAMIAKQALYSSD